MSSLKKVTQKGFTIVELLIVIVVIGILAALVITTYNGIQQKTRNTQRETDLKAIQGQLEAYYAQNGAYPAEDNLTTDSATSETFISASMKGLDKEALVDPKSNAAADAKYRLSEATAANMYVYEATTDATPGAECTDGAGDCAKYTLTATKEGGGTVVLKSLN
jgi:type II secretion system protein G